MTTDKGQQLCLLCEWGHGRGEGWVTVTKIIDQQSHDNLMSNLSELHVKPLFNKVLFVVLSGCILCYRYCHISMQSAYVRTYIRTFSVAGSTRSSSHRSLGPQSMATQLAGLSRIVHFVW